MKIIKCEYLSFPGNNINEDIATVNEKSAWVLDGATGLNNKNLIDSKSDAKWFVNEWDNYLKNNIDDSEKDLKEIAREGIIKIKQKFLSKIGNCKIEPIDLPSSGIVLIRWDEREIEYFILGDCTLFYKLESDFIKEIKDESLQLLDSQVINKMKKIMLNGKGIKEAREDVKDNLVNNRLQMNTNEGYWILGFDEEAIKHSIYNKIKINNNNIQLLLMSDGFSALFNTYEYIDKYNIFKELEKTNLNQLYNLLRKIEDEDKDGFKYPRFKKSDDASAVYLFIKP